MTIWHGKRGVLTENEHLSVFVKSPRFPLQTVSTVGGVLVRQFTIAKAPE